MSNLFSLAWRCLLTAALVFNPVLGAASMRADDAGNAAAAKAAATQAMPPCHGGMAHESAPPQPPATPDKQPADCGCQFAACCIVAALELGKPLRMPAMLTGTQALPSRGLREADAPPPARLIRPPIA